MSGKCPSCGAPVSIVAAVSPESRMTFKIWPEKDSAKILTASTVGGVLTNIEKLIQATAKSIGGRVAVFVESIKSDPQDGSIEVALLTLENKKK